MIEDSNNANGPIYNYEYVYKQINNNSRKFVSQPEFPINSFGIEKIKLKESKLDLTLWEAKDFPKFNFKIIKSQLILDNIRSNKYITSKPMMVVSVSTPLFINKNKFIIGFSSSDTKLGSNSIEHFAALMVRKKGKWVKIYEYSDGVYY